MIGQTIPISAGILTDRMFYADGGGGGGGVSFEVTAKSVIFDIADNWGNATMGVRQFDFYFEGSKIAMLPVSYTAYATSVAAFGAVVHAFDTSLSKTGTHADQGWLANSAAVNQRVIIVFDTEQTFDEIIYNGYHSTGTSVDAGAKNLVITSSTDSITNTTYNAAIANSTALFDGLANRHHESDSAQDFSLYPYVAQAGVKSVIFDVADNWGNATMGIRQFDFKNGGSKIAMVPADYMAYATSVLHPVVDLFDTTTSKIGTNSGEGWLAAGGTNTNQRCVIVFEGFQVFDEIVYNGYHAAGVDTNAGAKNLVINTSTDAIYSTTYNAAISNSTEILDGQAEQHAATDTAQDYSIWP